MRRDVRYLLMGLIGIVSLEFINILNNILIRQSVHFGLASYTILIVLVGTFLTFKYKQKNTEKLVLLIIAYSILVMIIGYIIGFKTMILTFTNRVGSSEYLIPYGFKIYLPVLIYFVIYRYNQRDYNIKTKLNN